MNTGQVNAQVVNRNIKISSGSVGRKRKELHIYEYLPSEVKSEKKK